MLGREHDRRRGSVARRQAPKSQEDRRNDLLEASAETFRLLGPEAATVADITDRAGVAKGTFYLYFPSKDHVLGALWGRYVDGFLARAAERLAERDDDDRDWLSVLDRIVDSLVRHSITHSELHLMVYRSANGRALEHCREGNERVIALLLDAVRRAADAGRLDVPDPDLTTRFVYHGIHGMLHDLIARDATVDADRAVAAATALVHRAVAPVVSAGQRSPAYLG
jgi:AcrR family transcriptional regulator